MATLLIRKLEQFTELSDDDKRALGGAASNMRHIGPREDIFREGDKPRHINLILEGWAARYRVLEDGRRQITNFLLPGDLCDARMFILKEMDHSVGTLSPTKIAEMAPNTIITLTNNHPGLSRALWWNSLVEEAIHREWIVNLGQRDALERMAHLFCELFLRLRAVGLTNGKTCELPLTQAELGDALGISTVHVNRTLMDLRNAGLVMLKDKILTIPDLSALETAGLFSSNYLHLDRYRQQEDASEAT